MTMFYLFIQSLIRIQEQLGCEELNPETACLNIYTLYGAHAAWDLYGSYRPTRYPKNRAEHHRILLRS